MDVKYDSVQDLTLTLSWNEWALLLGRKTRHFYDNSVRGVSSELEAYVFLAYSYDDGHFFANAGNIDNNLGQILIPNADFLRNPWLVNLSDKGVRFLLNGWPHGARYNGSSKLFIRAWEN